MAWQTMANPTDFDDNGCPTCWIGDYIDYTEFGGPVSLQALRDLLDAVTPAIEGRATPMVRLYAGELANALDEMGVGL